MPEEIAERLKRIEKFIWNCQMVEDILKMKLRTKARRKKWGMYFHFMEEILTNLDSLKRKAKRDGLDIEDLKKEELHKDLYYDPQPPEGPDIDDETRHLQKIRRRWRSKIRTENLIERIEKALEEIKHDEYYRIIELKYFKRLSTEEIAKEIPCSERTVIRHSKRLINELIIIFHGAEALER